MDQAIYSLNDFQKHRKRMTGQEMIEANIAQYLDEGVAEDDETKRRLEFLVYPAGLVIEIVPGTESDAGGEQYALRIGNWELLGGEEKLAEMEDELYDYGLSEGCFPQA